MHRGCSDDNVITSGGLSADHHGRPGAQVAIHFSVLFPCQSSLSLLNNNCVVTAIPAIEPTHRKHICQRTKFKKSQRTEEMKIYIPVSP